MHYSLCDYVLDVFQNALEAGSRYTEVTCREALERGDGAARHDRFRLVIRDTGSGMTEEQRRRALDPFTTDGIKHPGRHVGLGLPFLVQALEATEGVLDLESAPGTGTTVSFEIDTAHVDAPPVGDIPATFRQMFCYEGDYELIIRRSRRNMDEPEESYELSRSDLREALGDLETAASLSLLQQFLVQHEAVLHGAEV